MNAGANGLIIWGITVKCRQGFEKGSNSNMIIRNSTTNLISFAFGTGRPETGDRRSVYSETQFSQPSKKPKPNLSFRYILV